MAENEIQQRWINTPFAYTRLSQNLTLLQQDVLVKVSAHLQRYLQDYFGNDEMRNSTKRPKPLFSDSDKKNGIDQFMITYAELGVSPTNYPKAREAVNEVLELKIEHRELDKDGKPVTNIYNVFSKSELPNYDDAHSVIFGLNKDMIEHVIDYVFDMREGYVSHPEDIARIGSVEKMPMMYYLLKHKSRNWKQRVVDISPFDIKEYLGMVERTDGVITKIAYKKFSQFKSKVLIPAMNDINRLHRRGLIDMRYDCKPVYNSSREVGDPATVRFFIDTKKAPALKPFEDIWLDFLEIYDGAMKEVFEKMEFKEFQTGQVIFSVTNEEFETFDKEAEKLYKNNEKEKSKYEKACKKVFKKVLAIKFSMK